MPKKTTSMSPDKAAIHQAVRAQLDQARKVALPREETLTPRRLSAALRGPSPSTDKSTPSSMSVQTPSWWRTNPTRLTPSPSQTTSATPSPIQPRPAAPYQDRSGSSNPDSRFAEGSTWLLPRKALKAGALTSRVRGPEPRADGKRHAEESLRLPEGHDFQDIDEYPPKGFPSHLKELTPDGGGERLPGEPGGVTFSEALHERHSNDDPEHMANFQAMKPGIRKTAAGKLFVQKIALPSERRTESAVDASRKSTNGEVIADRIFRILGVPAPRSQVYSLKTGLPVPHDYQWAPGEASTRVSEHLGKDSKTIGELSWQHGDGIIHDWKSHERRYAVAKALLAYGDNHEFNTMLDGKHMDVPWKIDNGDALKYNAFGKTKDAAIWGKVPASDVIFPQLLDEIGMKKITPREAYRQMEGIAKIWRRHRGAIEKIYQNEEDPKQFQIFASRADSIMRAVDMFKGPREFARALKHQFASRGRFKLHDLAPSRKRKGSGLSTGGGSLEGSEFMARSFRWGMNV